MKSAAIIFLPLVLLAVVGVDATSGQLLPGVTRPVGEAVGGILDPVTDRARTMTGAVSGLIQARLDRLTNIVRRSDGALELDEHGDPAVAGEIIGTPASPAALEDVRAAGFTITADETIEGLAVRSVSLRAPKSMTLARALSALRKIAPGEWSSNPLHFESGMGLAAHAAAPAQAGKATAPRVGMIDGGIAQHPALAAPIEQRGFARGAPAPGAHGTAIASLIAGQGQIRGALPGAALLAADVYGRDPAGGNALAIARAIGWMTARGVPVVTISLVGPPNPILGRTIAAAQAKGVMFVAAVGNDGPAAPPAYPASYPGVIAVTAVDGRSRALAEAGRALHLDYAAPGADMLGAAPGGGTARLRGTSYAAPLVAARLASAYPALSSSGRAQIIAALDAQAVDLGKKGPDRIFGRGLLCGNCATQR